MAGPNPFVNGTESSLETVLAKLAKNQEFLNNVEMFTQGTGYDNPGAWTSSGREITNVRTSQARLGSAYKNMPLPEGIEGKKVADITKNAVTARHENLILDAVRALHTELPTNPRGPLPPVSPGSALSKALSNPVLAAVELLTRSGDLNEEEVERLKAKRNETPSADPGDMGQPTQSFFQILLGQ